MGQNHARIYNEISNLIGVFDVNFRQAKKVAKRLNVEAFKTINGMIDSQIEAYSIATPTTTHFDIAKKCIENDKHILIEKPFCTTVSEAKDLVNLSEEKNIVMAIGYIERHNPVIQYVKNAITKGEFGNIINITTKRVSSFPPQVKDVGVIIDLATHDIDVIRYLTNTTVNFVYCTGGSMGFSKNAHEDHANILLTMENGLTAYIEVNWSTPQKIRTISFTCNRKFVEVDYMAQSLRISSSKMLSHDEGNIYETPFENDIRQILIKKQEPLKNELFNFLTSISNGTQPLVTGFDGLETLIVAQTAKRSLIENSMKKIKR